MKSSSLHRWSNSLRGFRRRSRVSRAGRRRHAFFLEALEDRITLSLVPQMVLDVNGNTLSSIASGIAAIGSTAYFSADNGISGPELWKSDGTAAGTVMVKDIDPGSGGGLGSDFLTNVGGTLFFAATDGTTGLELWKSDGTAAGTVMVKDICTGGGSSHPSNLTNVNGTLFFSADDGVHSEELWKSDGTAAGTVMVKDINSGAINTAPDHLTNVNGTLFFAARDATTGVELWKSDGTAAGTVRVKDIRPGSADSNPYSLTNVNGTLFFAANDGTTGYELWKSNGTAAGTVRVNDIRPGSADSNPEELTNSNGTVFFSADDGTHGRELWKSDGTAAGTVLVKDINPGSAGSGAYSLTNPNGTLFFAANDGTTGLELWKSDGTAAGTVLFKDINPGSASSYPGPLTNANGTLFFCASDGTTGELWKSDGTAAGTVAVSSVSASNLANVNGTLFFTGSDSTHGAELWKSDGTAAGTTLVKDINIRSLGSSASWYAHMTAANGLLFFSADDGVHGWELWKSDGTAAGTTLLKDINPGSSGSYPQSFMSAGGTLYFSAKDATGARSLWKSDGTAAGTVIVGGNMSYLTTVNGTLFFSSDDYTHGQELWKSDGTPAGTVLVKDINPGGAGSNPSGLTNVNGTLFFSADDGTNGTELWKSDGTTAGTVLVKDIYPGQTRYYYGYYGQYWRYVPASSGPSNLTNVNGTLFFTAIDGNPGNLWKSDGTAAGTVAVGPISASSLTNVNGTLFFLHSGTTAFELWKSDGTDAGTVLVKSVQWMGDAIPANMTNVNGTLFFTAAAFYSTTGCELWKSDGTEAGTTVVKDIYPGSYTGPYGTYYPHNSYPMNLTNVNGTLFFTAYNATTGRELWQSDGTTAGTVLVQDLNPGSASSAPTSPAGSDREHSDCSLANVNGTLLFTADDGIHGTELWKLVDDPTAAASLAVSGFPATITAGVAGSFTVTARTADGSTSTGYRGTVHFTSSDPQAVLPADYTFTAADGGVHTFTATLKTAGSQSITVTDPVVPSITGTQAGITVNSAAASSFTVAGFPSPVTAGVAGSFTVTARDAFGNRATGYTGIVRFTSSDTQAVLPGNYTFTAADAGMHTFSATLKTAGTRSLTATDTANGALTGAQQNIEVTPVMAVSGFPATITAGVAGSFTVTARNADGSTSTGYRGTVHFTSTDAQAVLPADYSFTAADSGVHTFSATLKTAGSQSITVTDTVVPSVTGTQAGITVNSAAASSFTVAGFPSPVTAGMAGSFTVTARDAFGNRATGYTGIVRFTSSDTQAVLPGNYTFTAADAGMHTFSATLKTAGTRSLTATDTANGALTGAQGSIQVNAAAASRLVLSAPASVKAGAKFSLTVTVVDAYGNVATGYRGTIRFASSDSTGSLPGNYTFTAADLGAHTFTGLVLKKKGKQTITVTDTADGSITGSVSINVLASQQ
jgi:ELWxxDGT repeat protein